MADNIPNAGLTRRQFIKTTAAAAAVMAVGDKLFGGPVSTLVENAAAAAPAVAEDVWIPTVCTLCDTGFTGCRLRVHRVNGVVVKVEGNPELAQVGGKICGRSNTWPVNLYNPYRPKTPLKRTNPEKGLGVDPKWVEISWDEALNTVAGKLKEVIAKDPQGLVHHRGHRGGRANTLWSTFVAAEGSPNTVSSSNFCTGGALHTSSFYMYGASTVQPLGEYVNYHISVGGRHLGAKGTPPDNRWFSQAKDRGLKVVELCPMIAPSSPNPDEWVPIKPGTDAAFHLSMINVLLNELNQYDVDFIKQRTNGPYLIGPDGLYVRGDGPKVKDMLRLDQEFGPPLLWDPVDKTAKPYNDKTFKDYALEGTYTVNGVQCQPAFQLLKNHVKKYTPEYQEGITTVPAETVRRLAKELVEAAKIGSTIVIDGVKLPYRPASVGFSKGYSGSKAMHTQISVRLLNMMIGNANCPGGWSAIESDNTWLEPNPADGVILPTSKTGGGFYEYYTKPKFPPEKMDTSSLWPGVYKTDSLTWYVINDPEKYWLQHKPLMFAFTGGNVLGSTFSPAFIAEALKKIPFIWGIPIQLDDIAQMCDVVLPDTTNFEKYYLNTWNDPHTFSQNDALMQPVVKEPVFPNTRDGNETILDIAERAGLLFGKGGMNDRLNASYGLKDALALDLNKRYSFEEIMDRRLKARHGAAYGLAYFKEKGGKTYKEQTVADRYQVPLWPNTRSPIYFEYFNWWREQLRKDLAEIKQKYGVEARKPNNEFPVNYIQPLPDYLIRPEFDAPAEYDLFCIHYKDMLRSMATFMDNAWINEHYRSGYDPYGMNIMIHPETAQKKGIKNGDLIVIESRWGQTTGEAALTKLIRPDTIALGALSGATSTDAWPPSREGPLPNNLLWGSDEYRDQITGNTMNGTKVKVHKA
jgi:anaerobic selenocysteine-containing dehydrogenase